MSWNLVQATSSTTDALEWPSELELASPECHVWFVFLHCVRDAALLDRYRGLLTAEERAGEFRFRFPEDRHRYIVTRALVRTVLSLYAPISPAEWSFRANAYGRPEIANDAMPGVGLSFNVSHTRGVVMMGVSRHCAIGVDTENVRRSPASMEMAQHFCSRHEMAELRSELDDDRRAERLLDIWTLKEAYVKARGVGLSMPLDQISFSLPGRRGIEIAFDGGVQDQRDNWDFWMLRPSVDHKSAVCVGRSGGKAFAPAVHSAIPLVMHQVMTSPVTRQSE
jgi:4'-phosphopantetheinyl transferase